MNILPVLLFAGIAAIGGVVLLRSLDRRSWRRSLVAYRLRLPAGLSAEQIATWLATATASGGSSFRLLDAPPLCLETVASRGDIQTYLLVPKSRDAAVLGSLRAALPGVRLEEDSGYLKRAHRCVAVTEVRLSSHTRPLATERAVATVAAYLAAQQPLSGKTEVITQWLFTGSRTPHPSQLAHEQDGFNLLGLSPRDREAVRAERIKHAEPLLRAVCRVGVTHAGRKQAVAVLDRLIGTLRLMNAPGVSVLRRWLPQWWISESIRTRSVPLLSWPLILNTVEAAGLIGLPIGEMYLPGVHLGTARQLPPAPTTPSVGTVLGHSNYPGLTNRTVALKSSDRLRHTWVLGPTGSGKSTFLGNLILQDAARGDGIVVVDARGDLIPDLLNRMPVHRHNDVVVVDPSRTDRTPGLNVLRSANRELAVDHVLHVLRSLYADSWGPRTADVLRASLLTLTNAEAANSQAFTLVELPTLLTDDTFRRLVVGQATLPPGVGDFWRWYEQLSLAERANVIGPVMNKIRAFTTRRPLRLLLGQSEGINLSDVFTKRRIMLVPLSRGSLGPETAQLVGSLFTGLLWQATLERVSVPVERRRPAWFYADEFQETIRLPLDLADMFSQARGLGLGITVAHQYMSQLNTTVRDAVLGTVRTQIAFQMEYPDANVLARSFAPLTRDDLMNLDPYEVAVRPCVSGRTRSPVTVATAALPAATVNGDALGAESQRHYGLPAAEIEAGLSARIGHVEQHLQPRFFGSRPADDHPEDAS